MDKKTLSTYGWIIVSILALAVMIAFATPFGSFVRDATSNSLSGLIDIADKGSSQEGLNNLENEFEAELDEFMNSKDPENCTHTITQKSLNDKEHAFYCSNCSKSFGTAEHEKVDNLCLYCEGGQVANPCTSCPLYYYTHNAGDKKINDFLCVRTCQNCGKIKEVVQHDFTGSYPASGYCRGCKYHCTHEFELKIGPITSASMPNYHGYKCTHCNANVKTELHSFINGVCTQCNVTCKHSMYSIVTDRITGQKTKVCSACKATIE